MRLRKRTPGDVWMQLTSLIDIIFLLLIFFMCSTELNKSENEAITLPLAYKARAEEGCPGDRLTVTIAHGRESSPWDLRVRGKTYTLQEIEELIGRTAAAAGKDEQGVSELPVKIRADAECPYKYVNKLMDICGRNGIHRLSFGASPINGNVPVPAGVGRTVTGIVGGGGAGPVPATGPAWPRR
jgi:biopolymer transport protein ExbD